MTSYRHSWTEQIYHYAEYLYWEPQHINKKTPANEGGRQKFEVVREKIRKQEVSLNILFNILLRLLSPQIKTRLLSSFISSNTTLFGQSLNTINIDEQIPELNFTQPDIVLQSEKVHICIELKIDAVLTLNQLYKYLFLLALWQYKQGKKWQPHLYFLTKNPLAKQWKAQERKAIFAHNDNTTGLYTYLQQNNYPDRFGPKSKFAYLHADVANIISKLRLGWASWQMIGDILENELNTTLARNVSDEATTLKTLLHDFISELKQRQLFKSTNNIPTGIL